MYGESGKEESKAVKECKELFTKQNELFDVYAEDPEIRKKLEKEWGVSMSEMEYKYYEDQKTERKMFCSKGVDPVWYHSMMKAQRMREREEDYRREREQFSYECMDAISQILIEAGVIISSSSDEKETFDEGPTAAIKGDNAERTTSKAKKRKLYIEKVDTQIDPLPSEHRHIRSSE